MATEMSIRFLLLLIVGVHSVDLQDPEPAELQPLFNSLKEYGLPEVARLNKEHPELNLQQYLVVAVLTRDEFEKANNWSSNNLAELERDNRVRTYINENRGGRKPFHGEMMFLYEKGGVEDMATQVRSKAGTAAVPIVVMYSFYIPCAHISELKYSCSEELAREAASQKYPMFIAFSKVYEHTSDNSSATYMALGKIKVFVEGTPYTKFSYMPEKTPKVGGIFQTEYSNCLNEFGVADCNNETIKEAVKTRFVNTIVYMCTKDSKSTGMLTRYNRGVFVKCLHNFINNCNSCNTCSQQVIVKYVYQFCAVSIIRPGLAFGAANDVDDNSWERHEGPWNHVVKTQPDFSTKPSLPCNARDNALQDCLKSLKTNAGRLPDMLDMSKDVKSGVGNYFREQRNQRKIERRNKM